ncbi:PREDICTED: peroxisomal membrane protein PEX14-like [Diuraphis noxia]|uniref:peroxisomal membrane protein PEX14-like n=1 Tax=Diuraphis noxia TaxID=143948 RepID=UPI0007636AEA|nr:PREDICTED: peroxisomal membrane protein PEX14-like [Diuraphis noxia]
MSRNDNKVNSDDNSVADNAVVNSGDGTPTNNPSTKTATAAQSTSNNSEKNVMMNNSQILEPPIPAIRANVVAKAIEFLVLESVQKMSAERKINFLSKKGLTDAEIQYSIQRAAMICYDNLSLHKTNPPPVHYNASSAVQTSFESQSWYSRLFGPIAFAAAIVYIGYKLYKKYIENWLFGVKKIPLEVRLETLELSVQRCLMMLEERDNSFKSSNTYADQQKDFCTQVRAELMSIKKLLLNRFQFPPAPASSSIPQWQLPKKTKSQVEQKKINSRDVPNSLQTNEKNIHLNETQKSPIIGIQLNGLNGSDNDKDQLTINSTSNETPFPTSSNQNSIVRENVNGNGDISSEHIKNNEGVNQ